MATHDGCRPSHFTLHIYHLFRIFQRQASGVSGHPFTYECQTVIVLSKSQQNHLRRPA